MAKSLRDRFIVSRVRLAAPKHVTHRKRGKPKPKKMPKHLQMTWFMLKQLDIKYREIIDLMTQIRGRKSE